MDGCIYQRAEIDESVKKADNFYRLQIALNSRIVLSSGIVVSAMQLRCEFYQDCG